MSAALAYFVGELVRTVRRPVSQAYTFTWFTHVRCGDSVVATAHTRTIEASSLDEERKIFQDEEPVGARLYNYVTYLS